MRTEEDVAEWEEEEDVAGWEEVKEEEEDVAEEE